MKLPSFTSIFPLDPAIKTQLFLKKGPLDGKFERLVMFSREGLVIRNPSGSIDFPKFLGIQQS